MKKIMFMTENGIHLTGYTEFPIPNEIPENCFILDVEDLVLEEYMHYKIVDDALVRMSDEEYAEVHPETLPQPQEPTEQEKLNAHILLELAKLKAGGAKNA